MRWQLHLTQRFLLCAALVLIALAGPAALLAAERKLEIPVLALAYVCVPFAVLVASSVTLERAARRGELEVLALAGLPTWRIAAPLAGAGLLLQVLLAVATPAAPSELAQPLRALRHVAAGEDTHAFFGANALIAGTVSADARLENAVLFRGDEAPRRLDAARLELSLDAARLRSADAELAVPLERAALRHRLRREFFARRPLSWITRWHEPLAWPHLALWLLAAVLPMALAPLAMRFGLLAREERATRIAALLLLAGSGLGFLGFRVALALLA